MPAAKTPPPDELAQKQLDAFMGKYSPEIVLRARGCLKKMCARLPGTTRMVYDNYNALVIGFGPSEKVSHAIFSIVLYPRWVTLFFLQGAGLPDPHGLLKGSGKLVRHIVLDSPATLDEPAVKELMNAALYRAVEPINPGAEERLVIKSVSARQRPRRPR